MFLLENEDFREFVALLNSSGVRFLIVGGHAVAMHGHPRFTGDLDIWIDLDRENAAKVAQVLKDFGFARSKFTSSDFERSGYAIQLGRPPYRIDILTSIEAVEFAVAYKRRKVVRSGAFELPLIGLEDLLKNKRAVARPQDLADLAKLQPLSFRARSRVRRGRKRRP